MTLDQDQENAILAALQGQDAIITGGAGTGKTTIIKRIAEGFNGECTILAPTGKAAARLKEATGFPACTIHRELCYDGTSFKRKQGLGVTIVDEASMIDSSLMAAMLYYTPKQLILVGDAAQLPPIGKGQPFHDLVRLRPEIVSTLKTCHRAKGAIHIAAQEIRNGYCRNSSIDSGGETWNIIPTGNPELTLAKVKQWVEQGRFDPKQDIILAPVYGSKDESVENDGGIIAINKLVKGILNPSKTQYEVGDRVIIVKNFGTDDLWNGDLATISDINTADLPEIALDRDPYNPRQLNKGHVIQLRHAYCLSVHKSQGSQFRRVFFVCFRRNMMMLSRELIYTAITRAKTNVVVCGETESFYKGIQTTMHKATVLQVLAEGKEGIV